MFIEMLISLCVLVILLIFIPLLGYGINMALDYYRNNKLLPKIQQEQDERAKNIYSFLTLAGSGIWALTGILTILTSLGIVIWFLLALYKLFRVLL